MALPGLVAANNLSDVANIETTWDNLGNGVTTISGNITIKGKDILALIGVRDASTRDFVFIKNLASPAQPRITAAGLDATSGSTLRDNALLKASGTSVGNYYINRGILNANLLQVNGVEVASISGVPFSGNTALYPLTILSFKTPSNFRFTESMPSSGLANPESAIPIETEDLILYIKAGQS